MSGKSSPLSTELLECYDRLAERENEARRSAGLAPITGLDLLQIVASSFAGLPMAHDVDLAALRTREKLPADMTTPPHPPVGKARAKGSVTIVDPPHGGRKARE